MVFVNLDGVAAAHGDVGLGLAMQIGEIVLNAGAALGIARTARIENGRSRRCRR